MYKPECARIGTFIDDGRLELLRILDRGSSGVVYLAKDRAAKAHYAVKCLPRAVPGSREHSTQQREIELHRAVSSHPNVVTLHCVVEEQSHIYLVMDYCRGGDIFDLIVEGGARFTGITSRVKKFYLQLVDAVEHCHNLGIYHRDIKPQNIFCDEYGKKVYLGDFGLSTTTRQGTSFRVGSTSYMSPECLHTDFQTATLSNPANDVWALGMILCSILTGRNPWRAALKSDHCWNSFVENPNFLRNELPISHAAHSLLRDIFTPQVARMSVSQLRERVTTIKEFFMTPMEIHQAGDRVWRVAQSYFRPDSIYRDIVLSDPKRMPPNRIQSPTKPRPRPRRQTRFQFEDREIKLWHDDDYEILSIPRSQPTNSDTSSADSHGPRTPSPVLIVPEDVNYKSVDSGKGRRLIKRIIGRFRD